MMQTVKIFGERNTGTHYLAQLIADNCEARLLPGVVPRALSSAPEGAKDLFFRVSFRRNLGWKHTRVDGRKLATAPLASRTRFVALVKNPYSFLLSLYKNPYHCRGARPATFEAFVQRRWFLRGRDDMDVPALDSPVALWNAKSAALLRVARENTGRWFILRYEDLVADPRAAIAAIASHFGLKMVRTFSNLNKSAKGDARTFTDYRDYYLNERWRQKLSGEAIGLINQRLDANLPGEFGYNLIETPRNVVEGQHPSASAV
jgi:hypothetical protein